MLTALSSQSAIYIVCSENPRWNMRRYTYKDFLNVFLCHCRESGVVEDDRVSWDFEYADKVKLSLIISRTNVTNVDAVKAHKNLGLLLPGTVGTEILLILSFRY